MGDDDTLISKLISETYTESDDKDQPNNCVDLRNYYEKRLNEVDHISIAEYIKQHNLTVSPLSLQEKSQCYRLVWNKNVVDFPSNWSIFKEIKSQDLIYLDQSLDQDFLLDIFSELTKGFHNIALVKDAGEVQLMLLSEENSRDHIKWLRAFFEKRNQDNADGSKAA